MVKSKWPHRLFAGFVLPLLLAAPVAAEKTTVLHANRVIVIDQATIDDAGLWVSPKHLTAVNGFELKPQGACLDELCIPIRQDEDGKLFRTRDGQQWLNVTAFAELVQQPVVIDDENSVYSFGAVPSSRRPFLESAVAPEFELKDRHGKTVRLSDFRGRKVMIITWASW